jgi:hypothetical protein
MPRSAHRPTPKTHKLVADQIRAGSPLASIAATLGVKDSTLARIYRATIARADAEIEAEITANLTRIATTGDGIAATNAARLLEQRRRAENDSEDEDEGREDAPIAVLCLPDNLRNLPADHPRVREREEESRRWHTANRQAEQARIAVAPERSVEISSDVAPKGDGPWFASKTPVRQIEFARGSVEWQAQHAAGPPLAPAIEPAKPVEVVQPTRAQALRNGWASDPITGQRLAPSGDGMEFAQDLMRRTLGL